MKPEHKGLSPSSLALYSSCQRKYFLKKIAKVPQDSDVPEDMENFQIGKAFHKCLEDTIHKLDGYSYDAVLKVIEAEGLEEDFGPMIWAMLISYKSMHAKAGLKAKHCEVEVETDTFYGFVDAVLADSNGDWWICDNKTAASYSPNIIPTLFSHPQLNLYAAHFRIVAALTGLDPNKFKGCRYRLTTKSKLIRKETEELGTYIGRLTKVIKSYDFILPIERMNAATILATHDKAFDHISRHKGDLTGEHFPQNFGNCFAYYRGCEFYSRCNRKNYSELRDIECVVSE